MTMPSFSNALPQPNSEYKRPPSRSHAAIEDRKSLVMRKFQIASLTRDGAIHSTDQIGPATPEFEAAFSGFAHGTLIKTSEGMIAVEDLLPGMELITAERGPMPLLWIGSMTLVPEHDSPTSKNTRLTRIMSDSFGLARPAGDLMAGPGARILTRTTEFHDIVGAEQILAPARELVDGVQVIHISPPRPVSVYHLCLHRHATINVAGLEAETFHPGPGFECAMGTNMLALFLSFFPHIHVPSDFGPLAHPRRAENGLCETG
ncbi:Hint domain-containing protein [uncultured Roseovarius sp.]|uniref:Hint domain-containing protein n=1 Tax=uncultured Roseovarius sp. TaxID=293344 RepID=UPI002638FC0C|nr:Hint domain-containing protein [uncultured Roseovarius sp.]